jgi:hypothetical protein
MIMNNKFTAIDPEYYNKGNIQCIDAMISAKGIEKVKAFCDCNAFKYEWRVGNKDKIEQDVDKTIWYLNKLKELWGKTETYKNRITNEIVYFVQECKLIDDNIFTDAIQYTDRKTSYIMEKTKFYSIFEKVINDNGKPSIGKQLIAD